MKKTIFILSLLLFSPLLFAQNEIAKELTQLTSYQEKKNYYVTSSISLEELKKMLEGDHPQNERLEILLYYVYKIFTLDVSKGFAEINEALAISRKLKKPLQEGMSLYLLAIYYHIYPKNNNSILYADSAMRIAENINDYVFQASIYNNYSTIYSAKEKYDSSTYYFLKSTEMTNKYAHGYIKHTQKWKLSEFALKHNHLELAESTINSINYDYLYVNKVYFLLLKIQIHDLKNDYDSVSFYFRKAIDDFPNDNKVYEHLAKYLLEKNKLDTSLNVCYKALSLKDPRGSYFDYIYKDMAFIYNQKGMYDSAEYYLKKCIADNERLHEDFMLPKSNNQLASFYLDHYQYDSASKYAQIAYNLAKESNLAESIVEATNTLSLLADIEKDYQLANYYRKENIKYAMEVNKISVTRLLKKTEIEKYLKKWTTSQQKKIEKAEQNKNFVIIVAIFLFIILTLLYYRYRSNKKALNIQRQLSKKINEQYEEIQSQGEELTIINEELSALNGELEMRIAKRTEDLKNANEQLGIYNKRLIQYANLTAHNIKAPLASIIGLVSLLNKESTSMDEIIAITKHIQTSSLELDSIIGQMSDLMNIDKISKVEYEFIQTESMVEEVENWFINLTQGQVLNIHKQISIDKIYSVKRYLISILKELLQNAFSFKNPDRKLEVSIEAQKIKQNIEIKVKDNGLGIDLSKYRKDIFQIHKRFHEDINGRGVGLYYVKRKIEALGGNIDIISVPQQGTSFIIALPNK